MKTPPGFGTPFPLALAGLLAFLLHRPTQAADWPRWRGPDGDGHIALSEPPLTKLPDDPEVILKVAATGGFASPVVAKGRVYLFDTRAGDETLHAIEIASSRVLWSQAIDQAFKDGQGAPGPRNTPQIDGDRVYAVSCRGELQCRRTEDGSLIWRRHYGKDFGATFTGEKGSVPGASRHGNNGSPLIDGDRLYACAGGTDGASVVCLDKHTGKVIWRAQDDMAGYAPPVIARVGGADQLFCYTVEGLVSLNPESGALHWRFGVSTPFARHVTTPVGYQGLVLVSSVEEGMIATRTRISEGRITHERAWQSTENTINFSSPIRVGAYVYGLGMQKNLFCADIATGKQQWSQGGYVFSPADQAHAAFIVMGPHILALTDTGELVLFEADPNRFKERGRVQVCGKTWSNPAFADGVIYLRDGLKKPGFLYGIRLR